jgi:hypothetical protein
MIPVMTVKMTMMMRAVVVMLLLMMVAVVITMTVTCLLRVDNSARGPERI